MPELWMPGAVVAPGAGASYPRGKSRMVWAVHHDTGGTNSFELCRWGHPGWGNSLCNWLFPKVGAPWQFAPADALTYHAGSSADYDHDGDGDDYNPYGPGLEVERLQGEELTDDQKLWLGRTGLWLQQEWGIPFVQYRGPFGGADEPTLFHGHVNHRDLHPNPDGLSPAEWEAVLATIGGAGPSFTEGSPRMIAVCHIEGHTDLFTVATDNRVWWKHDANAPVVLTVNGNAKFPEITKDGEGTIFFRGPDAADGSPRFVKAVNGPFGWTAAYA